VRDVLAHAEALQERVQQRPRRRPRLVHRRHDRRSIRSNSTSSVCDAKSRCRPLIQPCMQEHVGSKNKHQQCKISHDRMVQAQVKCSTRFVGALALLRCSAGAMLGGAVATLGTPSRLVRVAISGTGHAGFSAAVRKKTVRAVADAAPRRKTTTGDRAGLLFEFEATMSALRWDWEAVGTGRTSTPFSRQPRLPFFSRDLVPDRWARCLNFARSCAPTTLSSFMQRSRRIIRPVWYQSCQMQDVAHGHFKYVGE
jgi:hypothetical protein